MPLIDRDRSPRCSLKRTLLAFALTWTMAGTVASGDDWLFFRGPYRNGSSRESAWSTQWPTTGPRIAWRRELGLGVSSFAVAQDNVITMSQQDDTDTVWCLDANSGDVRWKFDYHCQEVDHFFEGGTLSTPTIDESRVYSVAYDGQVHCLDLDSGKVVWRKHLIEDFGGRQSSWDYAGSPLVEGDLIMLETGAEDKSTVALNKLTGQLVWGSGDDLSGYASPIPFDFEGQRAVLVFKARAMVALQIDNGQELWRIPWKTKYDVNASSPIVERDQLFISSGYGGRRARGALYRLAKPEPVELWVNDDIETKMNSAVLHEGHVYCISEFDGGQLMCIALADGTTVWKEPRFGQYGALILVDGKLVIQDEQGDVVIADASPSGYHELARAAVLSGRCWVQPVLANGRLYVRNNVGNTACLDLRSQN